MFFENYNNCIDYYPFGSTMPGRTFTSQNYRFGFNGMEKEDDITSAQGLGNHLDFGARIYDSRLGKWLAQDQLTSLYPWSSPYVFAANKPIVFIDPDGNKIDWFGGKLSKYQKTQMQNKINLLKEGSALFSFIYNQLEKSEIVFTIKYHNAINKDDIGGFYDPYDESINFPAGGGYGTYVEEFFHAYQRLVYGNMKDENRRIWNSIVKKGYSPNIDSDFLSRQGNLKATNMTFYESEAKLFKYLVLNEAMSTIRISLSDILKTDQNTGAGVGKKHIGSNFDKDINSTIMYNSQKTFNNWAIEKNIKEYKTGHNILINIRPSAIDNAKSNQHNTEDRNNCSECGNLPPVEEHSTPLT